MSSIKHYEFVLSEKYVTLNLAGELPYEGAAEFERALTEHCIQTPRHLIVQCELLTTISVSWRRILVLLHKSLKGAGLDVRYLSVNLPEVVRLRDAGVLQSFPMAASLRAALVELGVVQARTLDVSFINPFLNATVTVLKTQASTEARAGKIYRKLPTENLHGDISGVIGLISEAFSGAVVISFPADTFLKIMSRMLGETYTEINKDIQDGAGELTNIIFGQAKVELNKNGFGIKTAIPSVVAGAGHTVQSMTRGPRMVIPFETDLGGFVVEICLSE